MRKIGKVTVVLNNQKMAIPKDLFFKVFFNLNDHMFSNLRDQVNFALSFKNEYLPFLIRNEREHPHFEIILRKILQSDLNHIPDEALEIMSKDLWCFISSNCEISSDFALKWACKLNFFRMKNNPNCDLDNCNKFNNLFQGYKNYQPCIYCFIDTFHMMKIKKVNLNQPLFICSDCQ